MSAQYRPYRDEESVDGLEAAWSDNEPGSIQIYEKTTEEIPFNGNNNRTLLLRIAFVTTVGILGFLLGFFAHFHPPNNISPPNTGVKPSDAPLIQDFESNFASEDPTIKDKIRNRIDSNNILGLIKKYETDDRLPGSDANKQLAQEIENSFKQYKFDHVTNVENSFLTMMPKKKTVVKLLDKQNKTIYSNVHHEESLANDGIGSFLPLSQANATSLTTDQLIYVNRGTLDDFKKLDEILKINDTEGKVFVMRQSHYQAHDAVTTAQQLGAIAVLLFPDHDIHGPDSIFPKSLRLPKDTVRSYPTAWSNYGDLISSNSSDRLVNTLMFKSNKETKITIPVVPISFSTAEVLLRGLRGLEAPLDWNCFDFTLYVGPGYKDDVTNQDNRDKISIDFYNQPTNIATNTVTGIIKGSTESDRYILIGSRRDSLTRGVLDSLSGTAVMLELARVFGTLLQDGWRPKRTIIFISFGAESLNLIGSSHWVLSHLRIMRLRAIAYINCDLLVLGNQTVSIAASPLLYQTIYNATRQVPSLIGGGSKTIYDVWEELHSHEKRANNVDGEPLVGLKMDDFLNSLKVKDLDDQIGSLPEGKSDLVGSPGTILHEFKNSALRGKRPTMRMLDTQSIYSPFLMAFGVPVVDVRSVSTAYNRNSKSNQSIDILEATLPVLGTKYDNIKLLEAIDPRMKAHKAIAQIIGEMIRDLSDSIYLPFNVLDYSLTLKDSFNSFIRVLDEKTHKLFSSELASIKQAIEEFTLAGAKLHHQQDLVDSKDIIKIRQINDQLMGLERIFIDTASDLPNFDTKHTILPYNQGQTNATSFPAITDWLTILDGVEHTHDDLHFFNMILELHFKEINHSITQAKLLISDLHESMKGVQD